MTEIPDEIREAAEITHKNLMSGIFKLKQALFNNKVSGLLITEAEVASILLALDQFREAGDE